MDSRSTSSSFPGWGRVFSLQDPVANRAFRADVQLTREEAFAALKGETMPGAPIQARWAMGGAKPGDLVWTTLGLPVLVSERVVRVLRDAGITGWDVLPVELRGSKGEALAGFHFLVVRGRCGPIDYGRSRTVQKVFPGGVFPVKKGLYFDPASWDGSHLFMPAGTAFRFVVEPVRRTIENAKVKNALLTPLDEVELEGM